MAGEIDLLSRLLAFERRRAIRTASHRQVAIRPDAMVVCPVAMAGEDTTVHAIAIGPVGKRADVFVVPDPRVRDDQFQLFEWFGGAIEKYFTSCRESGSYPQLWVASAGVADHLDTLADRLRYNRQNAGVKRFGELLSYHTERYPVTGQQTMVAATEALRRHWATGQQPGEDEHLGALLAWIDPPRGIDVAVAVAEAERIPMGAKTDPDFDRLVLEPRVTAYNTARRAGASRRELDERARLIRDALTPVVSKIYEETQRAITVLSGMKLPPLPSLAHVEQRERDEFESFMRSRDGGYHLPLRDSAKLAAFKLLAREDAASNFEAAILAEDSVGRARALLTGHVVRGEVANPRRIRLGPRRFRYHFTIVSRQRVLRVRRRDELQWLADPRLCLVVTDIQRSGSTTRISVDIVSGQQAVGLPAAGTTMELTKNIPDWTNIFRARKQLSERLAKTPWTHRPDGSPPRPTPRRLPRDPLAEIEALR